MLRLPFSIMPHYASKDLQLFLYLLYSSLKCARPLSHLNFSRIFFMFDTAFSHFLQAIITEIISFNFCIPLHYGLI